MENKCSSRKALSPHIYAFIGTAVVVLQIVFVVVYGDPDQQTGSTNSPSTIEVVTNSSRFKEKIIVSRAIITFVLIASCFFVPMIMIYCMSSRARHVHSSCKDLSEKQRELLKLRILNESETLKKDNTNKPASLSAVKPCDERKPLKHSDNLKRRVSKKEEKVDSLSLNKPKVIKSTLNDTGSELFEDAIKPRSESIQHFETTYSHFPPDNETKSKRRAIATFPNKIMIKEKDNVLNIDSLEKTLEQIPVTDTLTKSDPQNVKMKYN